MTFSPQNCCRVTSVLKSKQNKDISLYPKPFDGVYICENSNATIYMYLNVISVVWWFPLREIMLPTFFYSMCVVFCKLFFMNLCSLAYLKTCSGFNSLQFSSNYRFYKRVRLTPKICCFYVGFYLMFKMKTRHALFSSSFLACCDRCVQ